MFEHKVVSKRDVSDAEKYLNSLSEDGWELVGVDGYKLYLKRSSDEGSSAHQGHWGNSAPRNDRRGG
jgi:hypothetical protein